MATTSAATIAKSDSATTSPSTTNTNTPTGPPPLPPHFAPNALAAALAATGATPQIPPISQMQMAQLLSAQAQAFAAQAQAAQAAHAGIGFPVMFQHGVPGEFKPDIMGFAGPQAPIPVIMDNHAAHLYHPYTLDGMKKRNATKEATEPLKTWLRVHRKNPYPAKAEKVLLAMQTRMTLTQVSTWFANARRRLKKENKATWNMPNRRGGCEDDDLDDLDDLGRPSSSTSVVSDVKDVSMKSETPSSKDETPKKGKIWGIEDVMGGENEMKKDSPSSDENLMSEAMRSQKAIQENLMAIGQHNPELAASIQSLSMMNRGFMFNPLQFFVMNAAAANAAHAQQNTQQTPQPTVNQAGLYQSDECQVTPTSEASPATSPNVVSTPMPAISPMPPRTATPAY